MGILSILTKELVDTTDSLNDYPSYGPSYGSRGHKRLTSFMVPSHPSHKHCKHMRNLITTHSETTTSSNNTLLFQSDMKSLFTSFTTNSASNGNPRTTFAEAGGLNFFIDNPEFNSCFGTIQEEEAVSTRKQRSGRSFSLSSSAGNLGLLLSPGAEEEDEQEAPEDKSHLSIDDFLSKKGADIGRISHDLKEALDKVREQDKTIFALLEQVKDNMEQIRKSMLNTS